MLNQIGCDFCRISAKTLRAFSLLRNIYFEPEGCSGSGAGISRRCRQFQRPRRLDGY